MIEQYSEEELSTADWFNHPDVVSGPFIVTDFDVDHYISYEANKDYWKGAPKIDKLNIKIVDGSQLYAGLQSGEIDITQQTMSDIPQERRSCIRLPGYQPVRIYPDKERSGRKSSSGDAVCD